MRICVISDMHCKHQLKLDDPAGTFLISTRPRMPINHHPVAALLALIEKDKIQCDALICPGDLCDKYDEQGVFSSWGWLEEIKIKLNASVLLGIPGNHDVNSRNPPEQGSLAFIKNFHESFPVKDTIKKNSFWELGYFTIEFDDVLYILINTIHNHKDKTTSEKSDLHHNTLENLEIELRTIKENVKFKVCIMHHHPIKHSNITYRPDIDSLEKGDDLIKLLVQYGVNIVIHGHKHLPRITEISGLPILAAGSFAHFANLQGAGIENMFHIVELNENSRLGMIKSWQYDIVHGWSEKPNQIFPSRIGFGSNRDIDEVANEISQLFQANGKKPMLYDEIIAGVKEIEYIIPDKLIWLNNLLKAKYQIKPVPEYPLDPIKIAELIS